jgi:hypothetical protein
MSDLTATEQQHVRAALRFMHARYGGWEPVGKALHVNPGTLSQLLGRRAITASLAVRVARTVGVGVDDLLGGKYPPPGVCPYCGHQAERVEGPA